MTRCSLVPLNNVSDQAWLAVFSVDRAFTRTDTLAGEIWVDGPNTLGATDPCCGDCHVSHSVVVTPVGLRPLFPDRRTAEISLHGL